MLRVLTALIACLSVLQALAACASSAPPSSAPAAAASESVTYEELSVNALMMTKPNGKYVRTSGAWGGAQPNVVGVASDAFGVFFYDGSTMIALSVPKALAAEAEHFTHGQAVTVEGRFEDRAPFPLVHVDRFVEVAP